MRLRVKGREGRAAMLAKDINETKQAIRKAELYAINDSRYSQDWQARKARLESTLKLLYKAEILSL